MAQFDVYRITSRQYAVDCQSARLDHLGTRLTVPLLWREDVPVEVGAIHPQFEVDGKQLVMATHLAGAVPVARLGKPIASLARHEYAIQRALDTLTSTA